jgi:hypothetical protein
MPLGERYSAVGAVLEEPQGRAGESNRFAGCGFAGPQSSPADRCVLRYLGVPASHARFLTVPRDAQHLEKKTHQRRIRRGDNLRQQAISPVTRLSWHRCKIDGNVLKAGCQL